MGKKNKKNAKAKKTVSVLAKESKPAATNAQKYSIDDLLKRALENIDQFQFSVAEKFCQRALELDDDNIRALETSGDLQLELGNNAEARQYFGRAITLQPDVGHQKYMNMGQLLTGNDAVKCFQKGIEIMKKVLAESESAAAAEEAEVSAGEIARAYCNIAEIYLTDECFCDDAEVKCKECLDNALAIDPEYPEGYHLLASFFISTEDNDKAKEAMEKGVALWLPQWKEEVKKQDGEGDIVQSCAIGYPERINACKLLIELKEYDTAVEVLELLLEEDDDIVQTWYLLGWTNKLQGEDFYTNARFYLNQANEVAVKIKCDDEAMIEHIEELLNELGPEEENEGEEEEENGGAMDDEELEDSEDEEKTNGESMEH